MGSLRTLNVPETPNTTNTVTDTWGIVRNEATTQMQTMLTEDTACLFYIAANRGARDAGLEDGSDFRCGCEVTCEYNVAQ